MATEYPFSLFLNVLVTAASSVSSELIVIGILAFMVMGGGVALLVLAWKMFQRGSQLHREAERVLTQVEDGDEDATFIKEQSRSISNELFQLSEKALDAALKRDAYMTTRADSILHELQEVKQQVGQAPSSEETAPPPVSEEKASSPPPSVGESETQPVEEPVAEEHEAKGAEVEGFTPTEELALLSLYRISRLRGEESIPLQQIHIVASRHPDRNGELGVNEIQTALDRLAQRGLVEAEERGRSDRAYRLTEQGERVGLEQGWA